MTIEADSAEPTTTRLIAEGPDWRVEEVVCRAGPGDRAFEERHDWTAIAAVVGGVFTYRTHAGRALMTPGAVLLGEPGRCFECGHEHSAGDRCVSVHLSPALAEAVLGDLAGARRLGFRGPSLPPAEGLAPMMAEARALLAAPEPLRAEQFALGIAAAAFGLEQDAPRKPPSAAETARAAGAVKIIEAQLAEPLSIAGLADAVGLGRRRFASAFRAAVGVSPYAYILARRLEAAAERLRTSRRPVLDIALDVGFGDLSEFTRRFSARFGRPPGRYARAATRRGG